MSPSYVITYAKSLFIIVAVEYIEVSGHFLRTYEVDNTALGTAREYVIRRYDSLPGKEASEK